MRRKNKHISARIILSLGAGIIDEISILDLATGFTRFETLDGIVLNSRESREERGRGSSKKRESTAQYRANEKQ